MEKQVKISTSKKKQIYGLLRGSLKRPLVVFVHGLTGGMNEHQFFNGARYFEKMGFSSFRFNLYGWEKNARKLHECTLVTHAEDLDKVISYFRRRGVRKVFVVGHSYGGKTILMSKGRKFDAAILWDPSHNFSPLFTKTKYIPSLKGYVDLGGSFGILVGKRMVEEEKKFPWKEKIQTIGIPVKIICAGKGILVRGCKAYYKHAPDPKELTVVAQASHCFDEEGTEGKLFEETARWFKRFVK